MITNITYTNFSTSLLYSIQMNKNNTPEGTITSAELLNYKKLTLLMLEGAC